MGQCLIHRVGSQFKATISVQANPGAMITVTGAGKTYTATANSTTGIATVIVKKKGTYTITTNCNAALEAMGNTASVIVSVNKQTYRAQKVKLNRGATYLRIVNDYGSNKLLAYWGTSNPSPSSYFTNFELRRKDASLPTSPTDGSSIYTGRGSSYAYNASTNYWGYLDSVNNGTTRYYALYPFLTINGTKYYGAGYTASGTAKTFSSKNHLTSSGRYTVPAGIRTLEVYCVGGGGGGGGAGYSAQGSTWGYGIGGGGGGGGRVAKGTISVTPGTVISFTVGAGGSAGNNGGTTTFSSVSAAGGGKGTGGSSSGTGSSVAYHVGSGGAGGSGGGGGSIARTDNTSSNGYFAQAGNGGSNGANGAAGQKQSSITPVDGGTGGTGQGAASVLVDGTYYSGGGGGGAGGSGSKSVPKQVIGTYAQATGGNYGGAAGGWREKSAFNGNNATANSGGGGGGGGSDARGISSVSGHYGTNGTGGAGGSGRVLVIGK